ncbi:NPC intracellular cholesterol transporter 2 homolog a-like [Tribolium madens]|uniref:NPC intracellular cholesterol transporter 2 homolog a-like n=1 Tax=Tribolium madens TaxID=41895 RepID=UPI001CF72163|nr:NPC intracellular cholesterol transporter 2 homolog a-like [Tribolium madens]
MSQRTISHITKEAFNNFSVSKMYFRLLFILLPLIIFTYEYENCGSNPDTLLSVWVSGCEETEKCILQKGTDASIEITFTSVESNTVTAKVYGVFSGGLITTEFPFPYPNACLNSGLTCPIRASETYTYQTSLFVHPTYPKISVDVKWQLVDDAGNDIVCVIIPAKIN